MLVHERDDVFGAVTVESVQSEALPGGQRFVYCWASLGRGLSGLAGGRHCDDYGTHQQGRE